MCKLACWLAAVLVLERRACTSASLFSAAILAMWASCSSLNLPTSSCRWQLHVAWDAEVYLGSHTTHIETHSGLLGVNSCANNVVLHCYSGLYCKCLEHGYWYACICGCMSERQVGTSDHGP